MSLCASCPALMLTSYASNQGKTTVTAGLAHLFQQKGQRVRVFKVGPDYLDPKILEFASGSPVYQLDLWMVGDQECRRLLFEAAASADVILVEGVMGLFDGAPSSADLAKQFGLPVVGVINAGSMAQSLHAVAYGLANFDASLHYVGTIANCVASDRHAQMIEELALKPNTETGQQAPAYLGALMRSESIAIPSRHLGLTDASEVSDISSVLSTAAKMVGDTKLPDALRISEFQAPSAGYPSAQNDELPPVGLVSRYGKKLLAGVKVGIAKDAAFSFIYQANIDFLTDMGAKMFYFSPLSDREIPVVDAVYLPGGYPELHLETLQSNASMKASLHRHLQANKVVYAECGGMLFLLEELSDAAGNTGRMAGLLKGRARLQKKLSRLGYQQFSLQDGEIRGHTFHYSDAEVEAPVIARAYHPHSHAEGEALYRQGNITASYVHLYFPSNPVAAAGFFHSNS